MNKRNGSLLSIALVACLAGCHAPAGNETVKMERVTTPTATAARSHAAAEATPIAARSGSTAKSFSAALTPVDHDPVLFEMPGSMVRGEPTEGICYGDNHIQMLCGPFRFLANVAFFPISMIDTPPAVGMESDGLPSRKVFGDVFDAQAGDRKETDKKNVS